MFKSLAYALLLFGLFLLITVPVQAQTYLNFGVTFSQPKHEFNGHNPARRVGNMHHSLTRSSAALNVALGMDGPAFNGTNSRVELAASLGQKERLSTANGANRRVRGLNYTTDVRTSRIGAHVWLETGSQGNWRTEFGAGLGIRHSHLTISDPTFSDTRQGTAPYAMLGARTSRDMGRGTRIFVEARYVHSSPFTVSLSNGGTLSHEVSGPEVTIGLQFDLP